MMPNPINRIPVLFGSLATAGALAALPLFGAALSGKSLSIYLEFPPLTRYVQHAPFNMGIFFFIAFLNLLMISGLAILLKRAWNRSGNTTVNSQRHARLPLWGWMGFGILLAGWVLAWTRFSFFSEFQAHTFCLPWVGYIIWVNAWCVKKSGRSLLTHYSVRFGLLFPVSALFWWFFEYLNRFVQNWYYIGVEDYSPLAYVFHASLAFSTVLPAVLSTQQLLLAYPLFHSGMTGLTRAAFPESRLPALAAVLLSAWGLAWIGYWPDLLYPLVWAAPLLVITSLQAISGQRTIFHGLRSGDWRTLTTAALAALVCGFFWELWNFRSLARWEYAIPYVDCCHIFAMPLLGYGGYLPFGLECLVVGQWVLREIAPPLHPR